MKEHDMIEYAIKIDRRVISTDKEEYKKVIEEERIDVIKRINFLNVELEVLKDTINKYEQVRDEVPARDAELKRVMLERLERYYGKLNVLNILMAKYGR